MLPWRLLDSTTVPGDGGEMSLYRRGSEFSIRVGTTELMNNRAHGSEDALAEVACERLADRRKARVLIGGLGMGYTLVGVLDRVGKQSAVIVAELVPAVVRWNREQLADVNGAALRDRRVTVREIDVATAIHAEEGAWDAILLDVDNGPTGLSSKWNDRLYSLDGLRAAFAALRPRGILAVWSAGPDRGFTRRMRRAGFETDEVQVRGRGPAGGSRFLIWIGRRGRRVQRGVAPVR